MRTYEKTHPWITFTLDLSKITTKSWLLMGQAESKCNHVSKLLSVMPAFKERLHGITLRKGALSTTAIEGYVLSEQQAEDLLEKGIELPPSKQYLGQAVRNIVEACNIIGHAILADENYKFSAEDLQNFNEIVLYNLPLSEEVTPGKLRGHRVSVKQYPGAPPEDLNYLLNTLCQWLETGFVAPDKSMGFAFAILQAIVAHIYMAWIHPFGDGNGRTARLLELLIQLRAGIPSSAAHLLSNHYNDTRSEYNRHLNLSSRQEGNGLYPFIEYALQGLVDGLEEQIKLIEDRQLFARWLHYVYDRFQNQPDTPSANRRLQLALDISWAGLEGIAHVTEKISETYSNLSTRTIRRDIRHLEKMNLIVEDASGYRPRLESLVEPLPSRNLDRFR